jgi:Tfp pilus assembly protein PilN
MAAGDMARDTSSEPLQQLAEHFREKKIHCSQIVLTLSRTELELTTIALPVAEESELPALVASEVEQQVGDADGKPVADYLISRRDGTRPTEALAFSLSEKQLALWQNRAKLAKFQLVAVVPRLMASVSTLKQQGILSNALSVVMSVYSGEVELVVCRNASPMFVRTLRITADDPGVLAEQLGLEIQRSSALAAADPGSEVPELFLVDSLNDFQTLLDALMERRIGPIQKVDPLKNWERDQGAEIRTTCEAPLTGALIDYFDHTLAINLLQPKRPALPPNPWRGRALVGGVVAMAVITLGYVLRSDIEDLEAEVAEKQATYAERSKMASKLEEKADEARWVQQWQSDQVYWLDELQNLSNNLPPGQFATIRRLTASAQDGNGVIDLSVQVSDPERVAELEQSLRSARFAVTSKRVSEQTSTEEYPWQFETRATFALDGTNAYDFIDPLASNAAPANDKVKIDAAGSDKISNRQVTGAAQ